MAGTLQPLHARAGVTFALESLQVADDRIVVQGHWEGVRGLRFVRPTLVTGGRELLATLEHKPWAPDADPWTAAFPWDGGDVDEGDLALSVAPSVMVPLERPPARGPQRQPPRQSSSLDTLRDRVRSVEVERDALRGRLEEAVRDREAALRARQRMESQRDEAFAERYAAERQRDKARAERDHAIARRDEAIRDHEVATRAVRKLQDQRDAAVAAQQAAEAGRDQAVAGAVAEREQAMGSATAAREKEERVSQTAREQDLRAAHAAREEELAAAQAAREKELKTARAERDAARAERDAARSELDAARAERDELRGQRDDALLAHQALRRQIDAEKVHRDREAHAHQTPDGQGPAPDGAGPDRAARAIPVRESHARDLPARPAVDDDAPIGVRTVPAAGTLAGDLDRPPRESGRALTRADLVAIRFFGAVAALCGLLLLAQLLRVFV